MSANKIADKPIKFTEQDHHATRSEGWRLAECYGGSADGHYQIQKEDEDARFRDDMAALRFVSEKARGGSLLHQKALHLDETPFR